MYVFRCNLRGRLFHNQNPRRFKTTCQHYLCRETLWAEIVVKGANLTVIDNEDDKKYTINRQLITERYALWQEQDTRGYADFCEETGDAWTALNWLQIMIFKEIIYA